MIFSIQQNISYDTRKFVTFSVDYVEVSNLCQITIRFALLSIYFLLKNASVESP